MARKVIRFEQGWSVIHESFTKVTNLLEFASGEELEYSDQKLYSQVLEWEGPESLMETYFLVYTMCTQGPPHDYAKPIFEKYKESMVEYILFKVLPALREKQGEHMLKELLKRWNHHMVLVRWFSRCLNYLDRFRISVISLSDSTVRTVGEAGVKCFRDWVYVEMNVDVKDTMIAMINGEREGDHIDRALLNSGVDFFVKMGMGQTNAYEIDFETFMLEDTGAFYKRNASSWIQELSGPDFMIKVEECLQQEKDRVGHYLHASTETKLLKTVQEELLSQYCQLQLLENEHSGCVALLRDGKVEDLSRMYRLFSPISNGLEPVAAIFQKHVTDEGIALVKQATDDAASKKKVEKKDSGGVQEQGFVQRVLDLHDKTLGYVTECFGNHVVFHKAMKEAFEVLCNKDVAGSTSAELLASYCDSLLKKGGNQKLSEEAMEDTLKKVVKFLVYLHDKDLFGEFCRKKLARRLLFDNSVSEDYEHRILMKMKEQCGAQFTSKMDGMLTDIQVASENQSDFEKYVAANPNTNMDVDMSVTVLNTIKWPSYKTADLALPREMVKCIEAYKEYYKTKRSEPRKLTWIYSLGSCNVIGKFDTKHVELIVTTYQTAILMLFNGEDQLSYNDIKKQVNLTDDDVARVLHSLSCGKYKILSKDPDTKMVGQEDRFEFNTKFTDKMRKIKIPMPLVDEKSKKVQEVVDKNRHYAIDAAIVHIMKSRKEMLLHQLITECIEKLSRMFKPDLKVIKKRIEDLITREFLERDNDNSNMFRYLA